MKVRSMEGLNYDVEARTDWTVRRLKDELKRWTGEEPHAIALYYRAKKLQDQDTLERYKITTGIDFVTVCKCKVECISFLVRILTFFH